MGNEQATQSSKEPAVPLKQWKMSDLEEYSRQLGEGALIVIIHDRIYDVTRFKDDHPGGRDVLEKFHLSDASEEFDNAGHSPDAFEMMNDYLLGALEN